MKKKKGNLLDQFLSETLEPHKYTSGEIVRLGRVSLGLTQSELATIAKIPAGNISAYETGKKTIGFEVALKLSAALSITFDSILFPNGIEKDYEILVKIRESASKLLEKKQKLAMIA